MNRDQPLILSVNPSRAIHAPNGSAEVFVTLRNRTGATFSGTVELALRDRGYIVGTETKATPTLAVGADAVLSFGLSTGARDFTGYMIDVVARNAAGAVVDRAPGSLDVSSSPLRFPREGFLTDFSGASDPAATIRAMNVWGCNVMQFYDCFYKAHQAAPPPAQQSWPNLASKTVSRPVLNSLLTAAQAHGMGRYLFHDWYMGYDDYLLDGSGVRLEWGLFNLPPGAPYTLANQFRYGDFTGFGWQSDTLFVFDPSNPAQRQQWTASVREWFKQFPAFTGMQIDTVGGAPDENGSGFDQRWDFRGRRVVTGRHMADWTNSALAGTGRGGVINQVSGFGGADVQVRARQDFIYAELWHYDAATHSAFNFHTANMRRNGTAGICIPSYVNEKKRDSCSVAQGAAGCTLNPSAALLLDAAVAASGAYHVKAIDGLRYASTVFVPGYSLPIAPALGNRLLDYQAFQIGHQNLLRDGVADSPEPVQILSGATGSAAGGPGTVWLMPKTRAGFHILHLMNHTALPLGVAPQDRDGVFTEPAELGPLQIRMHHWGAIDPATSRLMLASPDAENAQDVALPYTAGSDSRGPFVTFTLPRLRLWSMVYLETLTLAGRYEIDARQPIRGVHFDQTAPGLGSGADGLPVGMGFGRWARYRGVRLVSDRSQVTLRVSAEHDTSIEVRLDAPDGLLAGVVEVPGLPGVMQTLTAPLTGTTGTRDLFLCFPGRPVTIEQF